MKTLPEQRMASFSACRTYRYMLRIRWEYGLPLCNFLGLNPSTADELRDDATIRKCKGFARRWGYGGLIMTNLFAFRGTDPKVLKPLGDAAVGEDGSYLTPGGAQFSNRNDLHVWNAWRDSAVTVAAWGDAIPTHLLGREIYIKGMFPGMKCLGLTQAGRPRHPVRLAYATTLVDFNL